jgi:hypothetical protein
LIDGNGFMYHSGDCAVLAQHIQHIFSLNPADFNDLTKRSRDIIPAYSYDYMLAAIKSAARQNNALTPSYTFL